MLKHLLLFFLFTALFFYTILETAVAQNQQGSFVRTFVELHEDLPRERIYVNTDRQWYYYNDIIWFSAFVNSGSLLNRSSLSNVLYVDLVDPDGRLADRAVVRVENNRASGTLNFDGARNKGGTYKIQAYTLWSNNFDDVYTHHRTIQVLTEDAISASSASQTDIDIQFLPESGYLIDGIESVVGVKALDSDGRSTNIQGSIVDSNGNTITTFFTEHEGMGRFHFIPEYGQEYKAIVNNQEFELPNVLEFGIALSVEKINDQFTLHLDSNIAGINPEEYLVFGHVRGSVYFANRFIESGNRGFAIASTELFPTGVVHFTVLTPDAKPIAERLVFNRNDLDEVKMQLSGLDETYNLREEIELSLSTQNNNESNVRQTSSLSVFDDTIQEFNPYDSNIVSRFYLENDLSGHVHNPGYYFLSDHEDIERHTDNLLLTQGWRAYDMEEILELSEIELLSYPETGITFHGSVRSDFWGRRLNEANVIYYIRGDGDEEDEMFLTTTNEDGRFNTEELHFTGNKQLVIRATNERGRDHVRVRLDDQFSMLDSRFNPVVQTGLSGETITTLDEDRVLQSQLNVLGEIETQMSVLLDEVIVTADRIEDLDYRTRAAEVRQSQVINLDEQPHFQDLPIQLVLAQIPGVRVLADDDIRVSTGSYGGGSPLLVIDGVSTEFSEILNLSTFDVQSVRVYRRADQLALWGSSGTNGVIQINTRSGLGLQRPTQGLVRKFVEGYQLPIEFYSPRYGFTRPDHERTDSRITLHWEPQIDDFDSAASVIFWTNDFPGTYRVVWEGMTIEGKHFYTTTTFDIQSTDSF